MVKLKTPYQTQTQTAGTCIASKAPRQVRIPAFITLAPYSPSHDESVLNEDNAKRLPKAIS